MSIDWPNTPPNPGRALLALVWLLGGPGAARAADADGIDYFETHIRPVLVERCYSCHSTESAKPKGGLLLDTRDGLRQGGSSGQPGVVPGQPEAGLLMVALRYQDENLQMPPKQKLPDAQIAQFEVWIRRGAPDPRTNAPGSKSSPSTTNAPHWAFHPPRPSPLPAVHAKRWGQTSIDRFILAGLEAKGLRPAPRADPRTLIRRATFDLHGLPPTPAEVDAFVRDRSPDAVETLLDRLLASPRYGERWGRHWLDVARYADTKGYVYDDREDRRYVHAYPYRDWVIRALNEDMPYDRFIQLQIAADQMECAPADLAAMGYLTLGRRFLGVSHDIIDDRIDVLSRGMQGLTVACARCHDHKFDPIPTQDYYSLYGVFASSTERLVPITSAASPTPARLEFEKGLAERVAKFDEAYEKARAEVAARIRKRTGDYLLAQLTVEQLPNEEFYEILDAEAVNPIFVRRWQAYLRETAKSFDPVFAPWHAFASLPAKEFETAAPTAWTALKTATAPRLNLLVVEALDREPLRSMEDLARRYGALFGAVQDGTNATHRTDGTPLAMTETAAREALRQVLDAPGSPVYPPVGSLADTHFYFDEGARVNLGRLFKDIEVWHLTAAGAAPHAGILQDLPVPRTPRVFRRGNPGQTGEEVPRQFLEIIAGPGRQPFQHGSGRLELARAIANRENPLTARVMVNRVWMHHFGAGLVKTPSDFGTRSEPPSHPELLDHLAVWFMDHGWSLKQLHRLIMTSAVYQQASDAPARAAHSAATLDPQNRLLSHFNRRRLDFESLRDSLLEVSGDLDLELGGRAANLFKPPFTRRRSVYGYIDRVVFPGTLRAFDFANPDLHIPQRHETTVPQQALFLMNSPWVAERAQSWAEKIPENKARQRVRHLYAAAFQRAPTGQELNQTLAFVNEIQRTPPIQPAAAKPSPWSYGFGELVKSKRGEWLDFVVDSQATLSHDDFLWAPLVRSIEDKSLAVDAGEAVAWDARQDFAGSTKPARPLDAWAALAQVLLLSNEFAYVD